MITNNVALKQRTPTPPPATPSASGLARAWASADARYNAKPLDRAGVSRGRGNMHQAGISAAQNYTQGMSDVWGDQLGRASQNAADSLGLQIGDEQYGQALGALNSQANYAKQMANLQRQGALMGLLGGN